MTPSRIELICSYLTNPEEVYVDATFKGFVLKLLELAESLEDFDYAYIFRIYLDKLDTRSTDNVDNMLRYMNDQAKDSKRSEELFSDDVISKLLGLIDCDSYLIRKQILNVVDIINIYVVHDNTKSMIEDNLNKLLHNSFESKDTNLINSALTSLLFSTNKTRSLPESVLEILLTRLVNLSGHSEECTSFIVFILSQFFCGDSLQRFLNNPDGLESISSKLLCDDIVELNNDDIQDSQRVRIEKPQEKNPCSPANQISLLAASIILRSIENKVILTTATIDNLLLVLHINGEDAKQTKIVASKCLYHVTKYMSFNDGVLNQMLEFIDSPIYDVSVYIQTAYVKGCAAVGYAPLPSRLDAIHLENITTRYVPESLVLGEHDFESEVNKNFFKTLLYEARKQEFTDKNLFLLFDSILNLSGKHAAQILDILVAYTCKFNVPEATVRTLENLIGDSNYSMKALLILQNIILRDESIVSSKTLNVLVDYLYSSPDRRQRYNSFKLLELVRQ